MHAAIRATLAAATTLATGRASPNVTEEICAFPRPLCHRHDPTVELAHIAAPMAVCVFVQAMRFTPPMLLSSRHRVPYLKAALADMVLMQACFVGVSQVWAHQRSLGYALSLHGSVALLHRAVRIVSMLGHTADAALCTAATAAIALYAWLLGPALEVVGVGASDGGCGAWVHLLASLAAETAVWAGHDLLHSVLR